MKYIVFLITFFFVFNAFAQKQYIVRFQIFEMPHNAMFLYKIEGDEKIKMDTAYVTKERKAVFMIDDSYEKGMYRCLFGDNLFLDFFFYGSNIDIITNYNNPIDSIKVVASKQNRELFKFSKYSRKYEQKSEFIIPLIRYYPEQDEFYKIAEKEYDRLQNERRALLNEIIENNKNTLVARYLQTKKSPIIDTKLPENEMFDYLKNHFFDFVDFDDSTLLNTDAYTDKVISFLKMYTNESVSKKKQEEMFMEAIDNIFMHINIDDASYNFILEYLLKGFEKFKYDNVLEYLAANYSTKTACENEERKSKLQKALDFYKKTAIGETAPDIVLKNENDKIVSLYELPQKNKIILFWTTTCPHCEEIMPKLLEYYHKDKNKDYEVYAVSIDTDKEAWKKVVEKGGYDWVNVNESRGWNNKVLNDYNIYATPTIFAIDENNVIVAKPESMQGIKDIIKKDFK